MGTVDDYLAGLDPADHDAIAHVYDLARELVPEAEQGKGDGMPALVYRGKPLISVMRAKKHIGVYPFSPAAVSAVAQELSESDVAKGTIRFQGQDITNAPPHRVVAQGISQSPEGRKLFPRMTVLENLEMGTFQLKDRSTYKDDLERVYTLFPRLSERKTQHAGTLSGGEQQMVAMGRALMANPRLLMLDEPSMGLAPIFVERIFEIVVEINRQGTPILLVEQNALMALNVASRGYVMETGHIALTGEASALASNEQVQKSYLGMD